jgi:phage terminase small subunit
MQRFVDEYLIDLNCVAAAVRAGYAETAHGTGPTLLNRNDVQMAVKERREMLIGERGSQKTGAEFVLNKLWDVATADARDIIQVHRVPCRYCHGTNGQYQYTATEMDRVLKAYQYGVAEHPYEALWPRGTAEQAAYIAGRNGIPFDEQGGAGYSTARDPNPACSECAGAGIVLHFLTDTRKLGPEARQLYRGVKIGNGRIEILMANQDAARDTLAKHYGVGIERKEVFLRNADPRKFNDDELFQAIADLETVVLESEDHQTIAVSDPVIERANTQQAEMEHHQDLRERHRERLAQGRSARRSHIEERRRQADERARRNK